MPDNPNRSEIDKLGTGQPVDPDLCFEQMEEARMDKLLETVKGVPEEPAALPAELDATN